MAIESTISLKDRYSSRADKIAKSAGKMTSAMDKVKSVATRTGSALHKAFNRTYDVKIKQIGDKKIRKDTQRLQSELRKATGKPYQVKITAKTGRIDMVRENLLGLKRTGQSVGQSIGSKLKAIPVGLKGIVKTKREVRDLEKRLRESTGKRHKIKLELEGGGLVNKALDGIKSKLSGLGSGIKTGLGKTLGGLGSTVGTTIKGGLIGLGGTVTAGATKAVHGGFKRLSNIQTARAKLRGFGHDEDSIASIEGSAKAAVDGTAFRLDDSIMTAAGAVAAGIEPGKDLDKVMATVANSAAAAGVDMGEMGAIFNKVATGQIAQAEELNQVGDRGIPIFKALAEVMGVDASEVKKKASAGEVDFDTFVDAMALASGTAADETKNTVSGALARVNGSLSKIGAGFLGGSDGEGGVFASLLPTLQGAGDKLNSLIPIAERLGDSFGDAVSRVSSFAGGIKDRISEVFSGGIKDRLKEIFAESKSVLAPIKEAVTGSLLPALTSVGKALVPVFGAVVGAVKPLIPIMFDVAKSAIPLLKGAIELVSGLLTGVVVPAFDWTASVIKTVVGPALEKIASIVGGIVKKAFEKIASVGETVARVFDKIVGAVESAVGAFRGIGDRVSGAVSGIVDRFTGGGRDNNNPTPRPNPSEPNTSRPRPGRAGSMAMDENAVGTAYFAGGTTRINERGEELIDLPRGTRIYPAGKTDDIIGRSIQDRLSRFGSMAMDENAVGATYFAGGTTRINERGEELIDLPRGTRIYPAGKTNEIIERSVQDRSSRSMEDRSNKTYNFYIQGKDPKDIAREIERMLKRMAVNI